MDQDPRQRRVPAASWLEQQIPAAPAPDPQPGQLAAWITRQRWGIPVRPSITRPTAATTAADVLAGNPRRVFWMVINRGTTDVNIDQLVVATAGNGVLLAAGGGWASCDVLEDAEAVQYAVSAIAASGTPQLWVYEVQAI